MKTNNHSANGHTINDVAQYANVSKATVSRVINNKAGVSLELEQRVKKAIEALDFHPNRLAQALKAKTTKSIGLIVPSVENPVFAQVTRVIESTARKYGFSTILCNSEGKIENEVEYIRLLMEKQVDGIIFDAMGLYDKRFDCVFANRLPVVLLGKEIDNFPVASVNADNRLGGYMATQHLISTGCRRIAFIFAGHETFSAISERFSGYLQALEENGIAPDEQLIPETKSTFESGALAIRTLLDNRIEFDAVFAANDMLALGCLDMLIERGIDVPGQVSVMGYDNIPFSGMARPRLSTVNNAVGIMSTEAVKSVLRLIYSGKTKDNMCFKPQLVLRQTTKVPDAT